jgi:chemotaxis protein CheD
MAVSMLLDTSQRTMVGMGQVVPAKAPATLTAVLGSCIGVTLYQPRMRQGVMAHVVLPQSSDAGAGPGKFADLAIPNMIAELERLGIGRAGLVAKMAGGACMFGGNGPLQIGHANAEAVSRALAAVGLRLAGQDVGGSKGRRIVFDLTQGTLTVEIAGTANKVL